MTTQEALTRINEHYAEGLSRHPTPKPLDETIVTIVSRLALARRAQEGPKEPDDHHTPVERWLQAAALCLRAAHELPTSDPVKPPPEANLLNPDDVNETNHPPGFEG